MAFAQRPAAVRTTIPRCLDLLVAMLRYGAANAWMPRLSPRVSLLPFGDFLALTPPKRRALTGTGSLNLFELLAKQAIFFARRRNRLFQDGYTLQQLLDNCRRIIHAPYLHHLGPGRKSDECRKNRQVAMPWSYPSRASPRFCWRPGWAQSLSCTANDDDDRVAFSLTVLLISAFPPRRQGTFAAVQTHSQTTEVALYEAIPLVLPMPLVGSHV